MRDLKIYIADDHVLFRRAIAKMVSEFSRIAKVREAGNGKELLALVRAETPDVAIIDLEMPVLNGAMTCETLTSEFPEVKIIVVSMHDNKAEIFNMLQTGAHAFLSKNAEVGEFETAIYSTVDRGFYRNRVMIDAIQGMLPRKKMKVEFSARETSIIKLLSEGLTNRAIGLKLSLSEYTVRNHKVRMMRKVAVKNAVALVKLALDYGLIEKK